MKKYVWATIMVLAIFLLVVMLYQSFRTGTENVIKYFPIDETKNFLKAETRLSFESETDADEYEVKWESISESNEPMYLRQDLSLLYVNGQLKGILNKWRENGQKIEQSSVLHGEDTSLYQAITFHHGEIHYPEDVIKSIQTLSYDQLYVVDSPHTPLESFHTPETGEDKEWTKTVNHSIQQQLDYQWDELIAHFNIPKEEYEAVPLTDLYKYENKAIPGVSKEDTTRILGQLWEGLYKNYVLGITDEKSTGHPIQSYIPLILFSKKADHLLVLFEDDQGRKEQLIQYYSFN
ncbi:hypothetical protein [Thalassobacillus devorans]|uniref:hypothetical protein n=1 Tax=Thalassobacillus devorans TaxID=279813 RepID=UPI000A1CB584|nr:hypothetical protein [Thalassobacillus devorans]